ncbi:MAG: PLP-dependent aminotransferase family protein [Myxococcales bacterium]|nr:PLP-dependent aminotransferase family protein [Myxococcales bacterium]
MDQSLGLKLDPRRDEPIHRQIFDQVVARIEARAFPAGFKLPPTRVLAGALGAHRNTVARAYAELESAGFVFGSVGRGTFVGDVDGARAQAVDRGAVAVADGGQLREMPWNDLVARAAKPELLARVERYARRASGPQVINLARMQPSADLLPDELMRRCVARVFAQYGPETLTYAPPEGVLRTRTQIALELAARGVPATADDVLVTSGSQQALDLVARSLVNPGDAIMVEATTYSGALDIFALAGARVVSVPSDDDGPELAALERLTRPDVKALYLMPNGHNPTGRTMSLERRRQLVLWSRRVSIPLIEDDYAAGVVLDPPGEPHLRALDGDVIHMSTFSKRLIPAMRIGYVVAPKELSRSLRSLKRVVDLGTSSILQHAVAEFIERGYLRAHMTKVVREYRARRDALAAALTKHLPAECTFQSPRHGLVLWVSLPPSLDVDALYQEALKQGVLVSPSPMWSAGLNPRPGVRLAFCAESPERVAEGARRLGKAVKTLSARAPRKAEPRSGAVAPFV